MENLKISVIMGVYNSDPAQLSHAIDSILKQTYSNFEFIICNDCSTNSKVNEILDKYKENDKRIRLISNKINCGLAASLNNCLEIAEGEYIARMDDDDISHPERFEEQLEFLKKNPDIDIVGTNINFIDNNGNIWGKVDNIEKPTKESFLKGTPFTHPTVMVRKKAYDLVNGYSVEPCTKRTEDYDMFMRMYAVGLVGYNLQLTLFDYRMDSNGYKKQKFKYRIDELRIKYRGFKNLHLFPKGIIYLFKPIVSGLIPNCLKMRLDKKRYCIN